MNMPVTEGSTGRMILSVHVFRRNARKEERRLQHALDFSAPAVTIDGIRLPHWVNGVRVEKAGHFQWAVVATDTRGH